MPSSGQRRLAQSGIEIKVPDAVVEAYPRAKRGDAVATPSFGEPGAYRDGKGKWNYDTRTPPAPASKRKTT
jgi:hypothetical protein